MDKRQIARIIATINIGDLDTGDYYLADKIGDEGVNKVADQILTAIKEDVEGLRGKTDYINDDYNSAIDDVLAKLK